MKQSKHQFKTPDEAEAVFYEAFTRCDPAVMAGVWADKDMVCVHPGSGAIVDYEAIIRSWANIFSSADRTEIQFTVISRSVSNDMAVHVVAEEILGAGPVAAVVLATNVYRKSDDGWRMIVHHGSLELDRNRERTLQ
jgi:ketosteroid isomerase-like protein